MDKFQCWGSATAVRDCCRIFAYTSLSLLLPFSFLLIARLCAAHYPLSNANHSFLQPHDHNNISFLNPLCLLGTTIATAAALLLSLLVVLISIATLTCGIILGEYKAELMVFSHQLRLRGAWFLVFLMQVCIGLGIQGTANVRINEDTMGTFLLFRRVMSAFGLHETMVFWWRSVVKPLVDATVYTHVKGDDRVLEGLVKHMDDAAVFLSVSRDHGVQEDCNVIRVPEWVQKAVLALAFGCVWWWRLREEAEALAVLPWAMVELRMDICSVGVSDVVGWWLYYLTVTIGFARVLKGVLSIVEWINVKFWQVVQSFKENVTRFDAGMNVDDVEANNIV